MIRCLLGPLRWSPAQVWAATPREIAFAIEGLAGRASPNPLGRSALAALMAAFPDHVE